MQLPNLSPYKLAIQLAGTAIAVGLFVALVMSWMGRGQEIASLKTWQQSVVISAADATVTPDAKGVRKSLTADQVPAAIAALKRSYDSCQDATKRISDQAASDRVKAEASDKALANAQVLMQGEYSSVAKRIQALTDKKAAATPELSCQAQAADSKAAWEAWK